MKTVKNYKLKKFVIKNIAALVVVAAAYIVFIGNTDIFAKIAVTNGFPIRFGNSSGENGGYLGKGNIITKLIGIDDIIYQPETDIELSDDSPKINLTEEDIEKLSDFGYVKSNFYTIDKKTDLFEEDINAKDFLSYDLSIDTETSGPKVLIFHTHSNEGFIDSDMSKGMEEGVYGVGERLKELLEKKYGISCLHHNGRYDIVDGKSQIIGAYERMEPNIREILKNNPSIEVVIDMHRDGVRDDIKLVTDINGKKTAQIMFFNGICKLYQNGVLREISTLNSNYVKDNLALSFNLQLSANKLYPGFTRKIYINAYRYSEHMLPKSILVEVGAQTNTKEEACNAMEPLADILASVLLE
ncbi:MAG: stage II sporulation protein P [Lachnospiraceae bacterium]|nr:stage II sporulation protein P [Lachnospiraceae bacterium]